MFSFELVQISLLYKSYSYYIYNSFINERHRIERNQIHWRHKFDYNNLKYVFN